MSDYVIVQHNLYTKIGGCIALHEGKVKTFKATVIKYLNLGFQLGGYICDAQGNATQILYYADPVFVDPKIPKPRRSKQIIP